MRYPYKQMLDAGRAFSSSDEDLDQLALFMTGDPEPIPAGYTYLGQFINHDITLELSAKDEQPIPPWGLRRVTPDELRNGRSPFLNLDTIYGFFDGSLEGKGFTRADLLTGDSGAELKLGDTGPVPGWGMGFAGKDLPRIPGQSAAMIVDARNDENLAIAQTQLAFMRFHNAIVHRGLAGAAQKPFEAARELVIQYYQWIIVHDYLPRIVKKSVLADVLLNRNQFYFPDKEFPFVPIEFSAAAFRVGHSMIRSSYNWNSTFNRDPGHTPATVSQLQQLTGSGGGLVNNQLPFDWAVNWNWFYEISIFDQGQKLNFASSIDTRLSEGLGTKPMIRELSIAARDLYRGRIHGMPTGQDVALVVLGSKKRVLRAEQIAALLPPGLKSIFSAETPLWFYLLAEAAIEERGSNLGEVGSRIVAETVIELIRHTTPSIFETNFSPNPLWSAWDGKFGMKELLRFVANGDESELDPLKDINSSQSK
jgi:hypothetical protein